MVRRHCTAVSRRQVLAACGTFGLAGCLSTVGSPESSPSANGGSWPTARHDPANTGFNPEADGPTGDVSERWTVDLGEVAFAPPVVDGDRVYAAGDGTVAAFATDDGTEEWTYELDGQVLAAPAVADVASGVGGSSGGGTVFVGSVDGRVYALGAADGSESWRVDTGAPVRSAPAVGGGASGAGGSSDSSGGGTVYVGNRDGTLHALDAADGSERWTFTVPAAHSDAAEVRGTPAVVDVASGAGGSSDSADGRTVYVGNSGVALYAVDAADGSERWHFETRGSVDTSPAVGGGASGAGGSSDSSGGGTVYFGSADGHVYAARASDGSERWKVEVGEGHGTPAVADGTVHVGGGGTAYALDAATGAERWSHDLDGGPLSPPAVAGETVYFGHVSEREYALDATDGTVRWRHDIGGPVGTAPAVVGHTLYVSDGYGGTLYALEG